MSAPHRQSPALRRPAERGMLHGLSLLVITVLVFGALAYFALGDFPLRCACRDGTTQSGTRSGLDSTEQKCQRLCAARGGGVPTRKDAAKDSKAKKPR